MKIVDAQVHIWNQGETLPPHQQIIEPAVQFRRVG